MIRRLLPHIFIALIALVALGRIAGNEFSGWDDPDNFTNNPHLNPPTVRGEMDFWRKPQAGLYVPVTWTTWSAIAAIARALGGARELPPWPFHVASLMVHFGAAMIVYEILRKLLG